MKPLRPNPVWMREMRQAARLTRTPVVLAAVTSIAGLAVCAVGGAAATSAPPAEIGVILFQTFFSIAFAVVAWIGPGVAALTVVSERAGHTWEAIVLTGLSPRSIATGKFLAALTYMGLYLVALAPVGALPFLFGGVTATEVFAAFVLLAIFAVLAVGFGLAVSSGAPSPALALLVTLPLAVGASLFLYFALGIGMSFAIHELWPGVTGGAPVWLPTAYVRADFGAEYLLYLVAIPGTVTAILAALFFAVTASNLADPNDDRSSGIKIWFVFATSLLAVLGAAAPLLLRRERWVLSLVAMSVCAGVSLFSLFALASERHGPSRRVAALWDREKAGKLRRFLGPGMARGAALLVLGTCGIQLALAAAGAKAELSAGGTMEHAKAIFVFAGYTVCFFGFLAGFTAFARTLPGGRLKPRARLAVVLFIATMGPVFAVAIAGITRSLHNWHWVMAPSPAYVFAMIENLDRLGNPESLAAGFLAMGFWALVGAGLGLAGARRLSAIARDERLAWARLDERLRAERAPEKSAA